MPPIASSAASPVCAWAFVTSTNKSPDKSTSVTPTFWHNRLGHPSSVKFHHLQHHLHLKSIPLATQDCVDCCVAKSLRLSFLLSNSSK